MKVCIVPNYSRADALQSAYQLESWLLSQHIQVMWAPNPLPAPTVTDYVDDCDLVVSLGGDGTLLRAARVVGYTEIPILGISYGHLGFLTSAEPEDLIETVKSALAGELHVSRRSTLEINTDYMYPDGRVKTLTTYALNDCTLSRGNLGDSIVFDVYVSGQHIDRLSGDGFIVATATGSTGYALAAGGPIVTPDFTGMVCVPLAPHTILARAFLSSSSDIVELVCSEERLAKAHFFADGRRIMIDEDVRPLRSRVSRGPHDVCLLDKSPKSFYDSVSRVFYGQVKAQ